MKVYSGRISFFLESQDGFPEEVITEMASQREEEELSRRGSTMGKGLEVRRSWMNCRAPQWECGWCFGWAFLIVLTPLTWFSIPGLSPTKCQG